MRIVLSLAVLAALAVTVLFGLQMVLAQQNHVAVCDRLSREYQSRLSIQASFDERPFQSRLAEAGCR